MMDNFEDELDRIRVELYEEWKDLSDAELSKLIRERTQKIAEQYNIKIIPESYRKTSTRESMFRQWAEESSAGQ